MFRTTFKQFLTRVQFHFHSTSLIDHAQFVAQQQPSRHFTQPPLLQKVLSLRTLSPNVLAAQYAVRGELVLKAEQYQQILKTSPNQLPFKRITYCNIGNPQELGQKPITFFRQVLSLVENPELLKHSNIFPADAIQRAKLLLENISGGTGAYTNSRGLSLVRAEVAKFITERDGNPPVSSHTSAYSNPDHIFLSDGASPSVQLCLRLLIANTASDGILIPIPQYPLYSATIPLLGGKPIPYYLDEENGWALRIEELSRAVQEARRLSLTPKALVVINPGNPTGQCLERSNMESIIDFCHRERLVLLADEVYQENVYVSHKSFISFKRVLHDMGPRYANQELMSFHSVSKGFVGECGKRGGYVEMTNIDEDVLQEYYKLCSINLCPNVLGQVMLSLKVNPPKPGDISYPLYAKERDTIISSLKRRAEMIYKVLNQLEGITCNPAEGAMYAFPQIRLPRRAVEAASKAGYGNAPDTWYCLQLLAQTGIVVVPGSGFGQRPGTFHFRTTFLPPEDLLPEVLNAFKSFHSKFMAEYKD